jgi:hypothetical protein
LVVWALALVLAGAGSQIAHAVAYRLVTPDEHDRAQVLAATGHHYFGYVRPLLALAIGIVVVVLVAEVLAARRGSSLCAPRPWRFGVVALVVLFAQEHLERFAHDGVFPWTAVLEPTFVAALVLQVPFALAAYLVARVLLSAARAVGQRLREAPPRRPPAVGLTWSRAVVHVRRVTALALGYGERGPPVAAASVPEPQVARTWKRGAIATRRQTVARHTGHTALAPTLVALFAAPTASTHATPATPARLVTASTGGGRCRA